MCRVRHATQLGGCFVRLGFMENTASFNHRHPPPGCIRSLRTQTIMAGSTLSSVQFGHNDLNVPWRLSARLDYLQPQYIPAALLSSHFFRNTSSGHHHAAADGYPEPLLQLCLTDISCLSTKIFVEYKGRLGGINTRGGFCFSSSSQTHQSLSALACL